MKLFMYRPIIRKVGTDLLNVHILFKCHSNENFPYGSSMNENYVISKLKSNLHRKEKNKFLKVIAVDSTKFIFVPITNGL